MKKYGGLRGTALRQHRKMLRRVQQQGSLYIDFEHLFRILERLHRAGLVTCCVAKWNWLERSGRPFRELAVYAEEREARRHYAKILPRHGR